MRTVPACLIALAMLAACTRPPDLGPALAPLPAPVKGAGWPKLEPLGPLLARRENPQITDTTAGSLQARASAMDARARSLNGPVVDPETQARMEQAVKHPPQIAPAPGSG